MDDQQQMLDVFSPEGQRGQIPASMATTAFSTKQFKMAQQDAKGQWVPVQPVMVTSPEGASGWMPATNVAKAVKERGFTVGQAMMSAGDTMQGGKFIPSKAQGSGIGERGIDPYLFAAAPRVKEALKGTGKMAALGAGAAASFATENPVSAGIDTMNLRQSLFPNAPNSPQESAQVVTRPLQELAGVPQPGESVMSPAYNNPQGRPPLLPDRTFNAMSAAIGGDPQEARRLNTLALIAEQRGNKQAANVFRQQAAAAMTAGPIGTVVPFRAAESGIGLATKAAYSAADAAKVAKIRMFPESRLNPSEALTRTLGDASVLKGVRGGSSGDVLGFHNDIETAMPRLQQAAAQSGMQISSLKDLIDAARQAKSNLLSEHQSMLEPGQSLADLGPNQAAQLQADWQSLDRVQRAAEIKFADEAKNIAKASGKGSNASTQQAATKLMTAAGKYALAKAVGNVIPLGGPLTRASLKVAGYSSGFGDILDALNELKGNSSVGKIDTKIQSAMSNGAPDLRQLEAQRALQGANAPVPADPFAAQGTALNNQVEHTTIPTPPRTPGGDIGVLPRTGGRVPQWQQAAQNQPQAQPVPASAQTLAQRLPFLASSIGDLGGLGDVETGMMRNNPLAQATAQEAFQGAGPVPNDLLTNARMQRAIEIVSEQDPQLAAELATRDWIESHNVNPKPYSGTPLKTRVPQPELTGQDLIAALQQMAEKKGTAPVSAPASTPSFLKPIIEGRAAPLDPTSPSAVRLLELQRELKAAATPEEKANIQQGIDYLTANMKGERFTPPTQAESENLPLKQPRDYQPQIYKREGGEEGSGPDNPAPAASVQPGQAAFVQLSDINLDPKRFQYKANVNQQGVTNQFTGNRFNPELSGVVSIWRDPQTGKVFAVNGHHRTVLAINSGEQSILARMITAPDAATARSVGALQNIAEGRGTAIDAANFFRENNITPADLQRHGISMTESTAQNGLNLSRLDPALFEKVRSGKWTESRGATIGGITDDAAQQEKIAQLIDRQEKGGKSMTNDAVSELAQFVKHTSTRVEKTESLFGTEERAFSNAGEMANILAATRKSILEEQRAFGAVTSEGKAQTLARVEGQTVKPSENSRLSKEAAQELQILDKVKYSDPDIRDALEHGAREIANGHNEKEAIASSVTRIRSALSRHRRFLTQESNPQ